jgi:excisionase family DNA binding protein
VTITPRLLSVVDASAYIGLSVHQIRQMIAKGELQARKSGRRVLVERAELDRWADAQPVTGRTA